MKLKRWGGGGGAGEGGIFSSNSASFEELRPPPLSELGFT